MTTNAQIRWIEQGLLPARDRPGHFTGTKVHQRSKRRQVSGPRQTLQMNQALLMVQAVPGLIPPIYSRYQPERSHTRIKPNPQQLALLMATCCLDAIVGKRHVSQVSHIFNPEVITTIESWRAKMRKRNLLQPFMGGQITRVRAQLVSATAMECAVVVHTAGRSHAIALRIERLSGRWRVTDLHLPLYAQYR